MLFIIKFYIKHDEYKIPRRKTFQFVLIFLFFSFFLTYIYLKFIMQTKKEEKKLGVYHDYYINIEKEMDK
jgi:hypothetical protein